MSCENLPKGLKTKEIFCAWRLENSNKRKNEKVPYSIVTGARARVDHSSDFTKLDKVEKCLHAYTGLGMKIDSDIIAIDLDHCVKNGEISDWAMEILEHFPNAYIEYSPSGTGLHILCLYYGEYDKANYKLRNGNVEVYPGKITNRFFTVTGNVYQQGELVTEDDGIKWLMDTYMKRETMPETFGESSEVKSYLSDESVTQKAGNAVNGKKFTRLWNGDITGFPSQSEADAALCSILSFYCSGDMEQIDRLFRKSALYRPKWDEQRGTDTYGNITIRKAVSMCKTFYKPLWHRTADEDFNDILTKLQEINPEDNKVYLNGDLGNGRLFADVFKEVLRYVPERKMWFFYDGIKWTKDTGTLKTMELCKDLALSLIQHAGTIRNEAKRSYAVKLWNQWSTRRCREICIKEAQSVYPIPMAEFDKNIYLFNCRNGTLDLKHGIFREHSADDYITKVSMVDYDPLAKSERFNSFVDEIMSSDKEKTLFLKKSLGYAVTGETKYECMFFLYGETTRNGKGTLMESVLSVMGDYGKAVRPETIAVKSNPNSSQPSEDIARLAGIRFANIAEPRRGLCLNAAQVKNMTGNDTLNARFLHENSFDFKSQFKLYVNTNYLPIISDMTIFSSNRVHIIPFDRHFEDDEQDKNLKGEFLKDEAKSAILNWLVDGFYLLKKDGINPPKCVKDATLSYAHDSDKFAQFAEDKLIADDTAEVRTASVYDHYKRWCEQNGCYFENSRNFNHELRKFAEVVRKRPKAGGEKTTLLRGFRLRDEFEDFLGGN